jgi:hypothetical protein
MSHIDKLIALNVFFSFYLDALNMCAYKVTNQNKIGVIWLRTGYNFGHLLPFQPLDGRNNHQLELPFVLSM